MPLIGRILPGPGRGQDYGRTLRISAGAFASMRGDASTDRASGDVIGLPPCACGHHRPIHILLQGCGASPIGLRRKPRTIVRHSEGRRCDASGRYPGVWRRLGNLLAALPGVSSGHGPVSVRGSPATHRPFPTSSTLPQKSKKRGWHPAAFPFLGRSRRSTPARASSAGAPCHPPPSIRPPAVKGAESARAPSVSSVPSVPSV
jgi:hypothetical protein